MVSNLVDNALHYTPAGSVMLVLEERNGQAIFTVEDTGLGIPNDSLSRIFERFYRVESLALRNVGGAGLGLAIVKAIVDYAKGWSEWKARSERGPALPSSCLSAALTLAHQRQM